MISIDSFCYILFHFHESYSLLKFQRQVALRSMQGSMIKDKLHVELGFHSSSQKVEIGTFSHSHTHRHFHYCSLCGTHSRPNPPLLLACSLSSSSSTFWQLKGLVTSALHWSALLSTVLLWRWYLLRHEHSGAFFYYGKSLAKDDFAAGISGNILHGVYMHLKIISIHIPKPPVALASKSCPLH